jgi:hypothetical protein
MPSKWTDVPKPQKPQIKRPKSSSTYDLLKYHEEMGSYYYKQSAYYDSKVNKFNDKVNKYNDKAMQATRKMEMHERNADMADKRRIKYIKKHTPKPARK